MNIFYLDHYYEYADNLRSLFRTFRFNISKGVSDSLLIERIEKFRKYLANGNGNGNDALSYYLTKTDAEHDLRFLLE
ncbi:MAG: hypothetical protein AAF383_16070 [Cyanobacteria bacterium P01_A01_bin.83]